jgi:SpoVK/Ycf46/Vps4 family AAA+-type ATPase
MNVEPIVQMVRLLDKNDKLEEIFKNLSRDVLAASMSSPQSDQKDPKSKSLRIIVRSESEKDFETPPIMNNFLKEVYGSYKRNSTKTKIFTLQLEDEITTKEEANPEYIEWEEKKKLLEEFKTPKKDRENDVHAPYFGEFFCGRIPKKTIINTIITKKVVSKQLNEMEKDFETLYLRERDKRKLTDCLDMFKNKGHIMKEMGLQNKFNLMLYGEPGTGKSTTIQAVANYLQKDIYYISLKNVKYNEDLQLIFEYVNRNVPNAGCLIMEDIDTTTPIVLKRKFETVEYKVNEMLDNQRSELTLEYLLNILQGTLTIDGSVFIVTTNHLEQLDPAFYRDGRFDLKIELKLCDHFQIKTIYKRMMGTDLSQEILDKIPENKFTPATIMYHIRNYIFNVDMPAEEIMAEFMIN